MRTLTPFICSSGGMSTASCPEPRNEQTMHRLAVTVNKTCIGVYINLRKKKGENSGNPAITRLFRYHEGWNYV